MKYLALYKTCHVCKGRGDVVDETAIKFKVKNPEDYMQMCPLCKGDGIAFDKYVEFMSTSVRMHDDSTDKSSK